MGRLVPGVFWLVVGAFSAWPKVRDMTHYVTADFVYARRIISGLRSQQLSVRFQISYLWVMAICGVTSVK
jgi:hypothetical protein